MSIRKPEHPETLPEHPENPSERPETLSKYPENPYEHSETRASRKCNGVVVDERTLCSAVNNSVRQVGIR